MGTAYVNERLMALAALLLLSVVLGGCAASTADRSLMDARAEVPAPPKAKAYPPVEDLPPNRDMPAMTADERSKLKNELIAARDRQAAAAKAQDGGAPPLQPSNQAVGK